MSSFFESLYANKPSRCRKLHNISDSILIFDEAQMMPVTYLRPCLNAIEELCNNYRCSAVLCTATQPALDNLLHSAPKELCPKVDEMYRAFVRCRIQFIGQCDNDSLAEKLRAEAACLCIVNRRKTAGELYQLLKNEEGVFVLTTYRTRADIGADIDLIRQRLREGRPCKVIATSLIEAGVDVDFPKVWREYAGLDSIIQAAGRCNREGRNSADESTVSVFEAAGGRRCVPELSNRLAVTDRVREQYPDVSTPDAVKKYFTYLYSPTFSNLDQKEILNLCKSSAGSIAFAQISEKFRYIERNGIRVFVLNHRSEPLYHRYNAGERSRSLFRSMEQHSITLYENEYQLLDRDSAITEHKNARGETELAVLSKEKAYDSHLGVILPAQAEPIIF